jgi:hypothetical protein
MILISRKDVNPIRPLNNPLLIKYFLILLIWIQQQKTDPFFFQISHLLVIACNHVIN